MKVKCPECKEDAELAIDCSCVKCKLCELEWDFDKYIMLVAKNDPSLSELLADYAENMKGKSEWLDSWD